MSASSVVPSVFFALGAGSLPLPRRCLPRSRLPLLLLLAPPLFLSSALAALGARMNPALSVGDDRRLPPLPESPALYDPEDLKAAASEIVSRRSPDGLLIGQIADHLTHPDIFGSLSGEWHGVAPMERGRAIPKLFNFTVVDEEHGPFCYISILTDPDFPSPVWRATVSVAPQYGRHGAGLRAHTRCPFEGRELCVFTLTRLRIDAALVDIASASRPPKDFIAVPSGLGFRLWHATFSEQIARE